jgi:diaminohydroxyphosphoribosylaminopyrimidine deaminase/5-amino-6-(5-phosphoribosylamino)uracil reductase
MDIHEQYMYRCLELAKLGAGSVAPNPMVGAVLVYDDKIIGEGYHEIYGGAHAEVNCIGSVRSENAHLITRSTLYVSLEPCAHYGKTPPCADLIINKSIPRVVVGCRDPFKEVDGKGIEKLQNAGIDVTTNVLKIECEQLNKRFFTFHKEQRPYVILKWAQSKNGKVANANFSRVAISNEITNRLVHKWRSEEAAIMVGTNTALHDDPALTNRLWKGRSPARLVLDMNLRLPLSLKLFNEQQPTIIFNSIKSAEGKNLRYIKLSRNASVTAQTLRNCHGLSLQSILVEGGSRLLQSFINENIWDETRVIESQALIISNGIDAPTLSNGTMVGSESIHSDRIYYYQQAPGKL